MKQLIFIAILLLGVVGCQKTERAPDAQNEAREAKHPPMSWKQWCRPCGMMNSTIPHMCALDLNDDGSLGPGTVCHPKSWYGQSLVYLENNLVDYINGIHSGTDLDSTKAKNFRENWLWGFPEGTEYINYYLLISNVAINDGIPLQDIPIHYDFAQATLVVADSLENGDMSCVPFTYVYKSDADDMIDYYRLKSSDSFFNAALDSIQADLDRHVGKTKSQIYDFYENP